MFLNKTCGLKTFISIFVTYLFLNMSAFTFYMWTYALFLYSILGVYMSISLTKSPIAIEKNVSTGDVEELGTRIHMWTLSPAV